MTKRHISHLIRGCLLLFVVTLSCYAGFSGEMLSFAMVPWLFVAFLLILAGIMLHPSRRRRQLTDFRARNRLCIHCGYNLHAHAPNQRCPECGAVILSTPAA